MLIEMEKLGTAVLDRREARRTRVVGRILMRASDYRFRPTNTIEHSETGARIATDEDLVPGQLVEFIVRRAGATFTHWAKVAWTTPVGSGHCVIAGFCYL